MLGGALEDDVMGLQPSESGLVPFMNWTPANFLAFFPLSNDSKCSGCTPEDPHQNLRQGSPGHGLQASVLNYIHLLMHLFVCVCGWLQVTAHAGRLDHKLSGVGPLLLLWGP